jgi:type I restriction enzyme M protein
MMDASKGFIKDGPKNRLREQDIHKIVDAFTNTTELTGYSRMVSIAEIADPKNDFNLNLPRYIDSSEPEDLQDLDGHLRGGIPDRDLDELSAYWDVLPGIRAALFESAGRLGYARLNQPVADVKNTIFGHTEFTAFNASAKTSFDHWNQANDPLLRAFKQGDHPKQLIAQLAEALLINFKQTPLLDAYDMYQHLMDYWAASMQDDCYLIADAGWVAGAQPREILKIKDKNNKLVWPELHDFTKGQRRFKSDLVPSAILISRYFLSERVAVEEFDAELEGLAQLMVELMDEHSGDEGLLTDIIEGEGDTQKITSKAVKARLKEIGDDADYEDERTVLKTYASLLDQQADIKSKHKEAKSDLESKVDGLYPKLSEAEIKTIVVEDKWMATLSAAVQGELDRVSQTLTGRIRQLAERYAEPLPQLAADVAALNAKVEAHLTKMGFVCK